MKNLVMVMILFVSGCGRPEVYVHVPETVEKVDVGDMVASHDHARPLLIRAIPSVRGCTNGDEWLRVLGTAIHHGARVVLTNHHSGEKSVVTPRHEDACGLSLLSWEDPDEIWLRVRREMPGELTLVTGYYLIHVVNPEGTASNDTGVYLSHCDDDDLEPPLCGK